MSGAFFTRDEDGWRALGAVDGDISLHAGSVADYGFADWPTAALGDFSCSWSLKLEEVGDALSSLRASSAMRFVLAFKAVDHGQLSALRGRMARLRREFVRRRRIGGTGRRP